jgi:signal transduction histidine kinase
MPRNEMGEMPPSTRSTSTDASLRIEWVRLALRPVGLSVFMLTVLWLAVSYQSARDSRQALHQAEVDLGNLSRAFAEHTAKTLEGADQALRFIRLAYLDNPRKFDIGAYLRDRQIIDSAYHLITVIGPDGLVRHSSKPFQRIDLSDRPHFRIHAEGQADLLYISQPVLGRVSGKWSIQLTRPIRKVPGSFDGVVVVSLAPEVLTGFYDDVDVGRRGVIELVGTDGVIRARAPTAFGPEARSLRAQKIFLAALQQPTGTLTDVSATDGIERLYAFRTLEPYGLIVMTGMAIDEVLADARINARNYQAAAVAISLVVLAFLVNLLVSLARQVRMVDEMRRSQQLAQEASEMKSRLLGSVSHELRTPLNGILGYAELLHEGQCSEAELREFSGAIHASAQHLNQLVNALLDMTRIETGTMRLMIEPVDLQDLLLQCHRMNIVQAQSRGLTLALDIDPAAVRRLNTDRTRVMQIVNNLLVNALKFTKQGRVVLSLRNGPGLEAVTDRASVCIGVTDSGIGISAQQLTNIFTRYHMLSSEAVHAGQGAGLGLPLARDLAQLLGGRLDISSELGTGTNVTLTLPLNIPQSTALTSATP